MKKSILLASVLAFTACEQSTMVFDPVNNKASTASTAATQGTVTLNVDLSVLVTATVPLNNQVFSILVFNAGTLVAGIIDDGVGTTSATGTATVVLRSADASGCITATDATLANGSYDYYFSVNNNSQVRTVVNTGLTGTSCGANGFIHSNDAPGTKPLYTSRGTITVNGNSTVNIKDTNTVPALQHTFQFATGSAMRFRCYVTDVNVTSYTITTPLLSIYELVSGADGTTIGKSGNTHLLPAGSYKYFCYADNGLPLGTPNGAYLDSGTDRLATGIMTVNGANTTYLNAAAFLTLP